MITSGAGKRQLCADGWGVELLLMLPKDLILDQQLAPFGFLLFPAQGQSQLSSSVGILTVKDYRPQGYSHDHDAEQFAQVSPV